MNQIKKKALDVVGYIIEINFGVCKRTFISLVYLRRCFQDSFGWHFSFWLTYLVIIPFFLLLKGINMLFHNCFLFILDHLKKTLKGLLEGGRGGETLKKFILHLFLFPILYMYCRNCLYFCLRRLNCWNNRGAECILVF